VKEDLLGEKQRDEGVQSRALKGKLMARGGCFAVEEETMLMGNGRGGGLVEDGGPSERCR